MKVFNKYLFLKLYKFEDQINYINSHNYIIWEYVYESKYLSEEFIDMYVHNLDEINNVEHLTKSVLVSHKKKINWDKISKIYNLSEEFMDKYDNELNWSLIFENQDLSKEFIDGFCNLETDQLKKLIENQKVSEEFINSYKDGFDIEMWDLTIYSQKLSESFLIDNIDKIAYGVMLANQDLSEKFIRNLIKKNISEKKEKSLWWSINNYLKLSEEFMEEFEKKINWKDIKKNNKITELSDEFIEKYKNKLGLNYSLKMITNKDKFIKDNNTILVEVKSLYSSLSDDFMQNNNTDKYSLSKNKNISEEFVNKYHDKVDWEVILKECFLTEKFLNNNLIKDYTNSSKIENKKTIKGLSQKYIEENLNRIDISKLLKHKKIDEEFLIKNINVFGWEMVSLYQNLSEEFIEKYEKEINWKELTKNENINFTTLKKFKHLLHKNELIVGCGKFEGYGNYREEMNFKLHKIYSYEDIKKIKEIYKLDDNVEKMINKFKRHNIDINSDKLISRNFTYFKKEMFRKNIIKSYKKIKKSVKIINKYKHKLYLKKKFKKEIMEKELSNTEIFF